MEWTPEFRPGGPSLVHLLIAAAGSGRRMGAATNKLLLPLAGRPVLAWTLDAALACSAIDWVGVMGRPEDEEAIGGILAAAEPCRSLVAPIAWIVGGDTRQASVQRGLAALPAEAEAVLIHDGARCLAEPELLQRCADALAQAMLEGAGIVAATPVTDTIKQVDARGQVDRHPRSPGPLGGPDPPGFRGGPAA